MGNIFDSYSCFVNYREINEGLLFWSGKWQDPIRQEPIFENLSPGLKKTGFGQTIHLVLTLFSIALVQLLLCIITDWSVSHYHLPVGAREETELARWNLGKFDKSPLLMVKYTDEMHRWKVEVEENTKLLFWRKKDKRSSDKFALDKLITVFLAARIGWRKIERATI